MYHHPNLSSAKTSTHHSAPRPYLNFPASESSTFNPKKFSQAALAPSTPRKVLSAPYIELPLEIPSDDGEKDAQKKPPAIPKAIGALRVAVVALRFLQLVSGAGLLVLLCFVRGIEEISGWLCRVPPALAIIHFVYAIYHGCSSSKTLGRTPRSASSYFLFAATADATVVPFYAFTAVLAWRQHKQVDKGWRTVFDDPDAKIKGPDGDMVIYAVFWVACICSGLNLATLPSSLYLSRLFGKIGALSPDSNPYLRLAEEEEQQQHRKQKSLLPQNVAANKRWSNSTASTSYTSLPAAPSSKAQFLSNYREEEDITSATFPPPPPTPSHYSVPLNEKEKEKPKPKKASKSWGKLGVKEVATSAPRRDTGSDRRKVSQSSGLDIVSAPSVGGGGKWTAGGAGGRWRLRDPSVTR